MKILHIVEAGWRGLQSSECPCQGHGAADNEVVIAHGVRPETPANPGKDPDLKGVRLIEVPEFVRAISPLKDLAALRRLVQIIESEKPDIIHTHSAKAGALGRLAAVHAARGTPVLYTPHLYAFLSPEASPLKRKLYWLIERSLSKLGLTMTCSDTETEEADKLKGPVVCVRNGVISDDLLRLGKVPKPVGGDFKVVCLSRIAAQKNPALFDRVAELVQKEQPNIRFVWLGGGDYYQFKHAECNYAWLERETGLRRLHAEADVYLQTSVAEALTLSVMEAMALGIPVVATRVPGNSDAVADRVSGLLGDSAQDLAQAVLRLYRDSRYRNKLALAGYNRAATLFSERVAAGKYRELCNILHNSKGKAGQ